MSKPPHGEPTAFAATLGITFHPLILPTNLKRAALLFENLVIGMGHGMRVEPESEDVLATYAELDFLFDEGVIVEPDVGAQSYEDAEVKAIWNVMSETLTTANTLRLDDPVRATLTSMAAYAFTFAERLRLERYGGYRATALIPRPFRGMEATTLAAPNVIGLVLHSLPVPDEATPWEAIIDFRNDQDAREKYVRLRHWMNAERWQSTSPAHIVDEMRFLVSEYEAHMRLHRMKINRGVMESLVTAFPEVIEQVLKLQFGKLAEGLFTIRHRQLQLTEAELKAPGREVAYIVDATRRFGTKTQ